MKKIIVGLAAVGMLGFGAAGTANAASPYPTKSTHVSTPNPKVSGHNMTVHVDAATGAKGKVTFTITGWYWLHGKKVKFKKTVTTESYKKGLTLSLKGLHRGHYFVKSVFTPSNKGWASSTNTQYFHVKP